MASLENATKRFLKNNWDNYFQTLSKNWGNIAKLFLGRPDDSDQNQRHCKKGKLQISIPDEYWYRNPQQNSRKSKLATH